jgi:nucleoside phosphorylase
MGTRGAAEGGPAGYRAVDVAILTVIPVELEAVCLALGIGDAVPTKADDGTNDFYATVRSEFAFRDYRVVLACIGGAGNPGAAVVAASLIARHRPRVLLLMGIAAGVRGKIRIGDVVLSDRVVAYEPAALVRAGGDSAMQPRPEIDRAPYGILQDVMAYRADPERLREVFARAGGEILVAPAGEEDLYREHVAGSITARLGTIASGEKLLRDPARLHELRETMHGKIEAGEMEAAGVVEACERRSHPVPWLVVRGISDFGDDLKDDAFHAFAARAAAAVLVDFLACGLRVDGEEVALDDSADELDGPPTRSMPPLGPSPFVFSRPIDDDADFFGREKEKRQIVDAIDTRQPVQILGESRMGKSSLLRWVQRNVLPGRPVVEVRPMGDITPASMVRAIAGKLGRADLAAELSRPEASSGDAAEALTKVTPFVLVMDDADALAERGKGFDVGFFAALRGLVEAQSLTWVSASRRDLYKSFVEKGLSSDFLNDAHKVWVVPLDAEAARRLAERGAAAHVARVLEEAGGLAYGIQWLGDYVYRRPSHVDAACDAFRDEAKTVFRRWWRGRDVEERQLLKRCLGERVKVAGLDDRRRRRLRELVKRGVLTERREEFVVEGAAWREFVGDDAG